MQAIVNKFFPDIALEDTRIEQQFYKDLGLTPPPDSMKRLRPEPLQVVPEESIPDIRFRLRLLDPGLPPIDRKFVFNAPRVAMLRRVSPFLRLWLEQRGYGKVAITFSHNDEVVPDTTTFLFLFGETAGTLQSPVSIDIRLSNEVSTSPTNKT